MDVWEASDELRIATAQRQWARSGRFSGRSDDG
jgi:hypothetical protein